MDESQKQKAAEWFGTRIGPICPSCHTAAGFSVIDQVVTPVVMKGGNMSLGGTAIPLVGLVCTNCFHIRFFSAVMIGVVPRDTPPPESGQAGQSKE